MITSPPAHDAGISLFGIRVAPLLEKIFTSSELYFVDVPRAGIVAHQQVERLHGFHDLSLLLAGAGHLIQHLVVMLVVRIIDQQLLISSIASLAPGRVEFIGVRGRRVSCQDRAGRRRLGLLFSRSSFIRKQAVFPFDLQICQAAGGFRLQRRIRRPLQERAVGLHGFSGCIFDLLILDLDTVLPQLGNVSPVVWQAPG